MTTPSGIPTEQAASQESAADALSSTDERCSERRQERRRRRNRARAIRSAVFVLLLATVFIGSLVWYRIHGSSPARPAPVRAQPSGNDTLRPANPPEAVEPTPIFASYRSLQIHLPVAVESLTEVGFHQASYKWALPIETPLPDADMTAAKGKGTGRDLTAQAPGPDAVLTGSVLRMWRSRPGKPNTAVDVGAPPGTTILAPIEGTVVRVREYELYGKYPDWEIHIRPNGMPEIDCVLIHIENPTVVAGDRVVAGVTPLGHVRKLSDKMNLQLGDYMTGAGDHTHIQLNNATDPTYKGLEGAIVTTLPADGH